MSRVPCLVSRVPCTGRRNCRKDIGARALARPRHRCARVEERGKRKRKREREGREGGRAAKCAISRWRMCVSVSANRDSSSNGARPMAADSRAPANARHIVIAGCGPVGAASGSGEEIESAVRATRLSASLVRRSSLSDSVVFSRRSLYRSVTSFVRHVTLSNSR